jgi:uncharacterized protein YkwD
MSVEIFVDANFSGATSGILAQGYSYIGDFWNDQISSIKVYSGSWEFFEHANFQGRSFRLTPGEYAWVTNEWNDLISSFKPVEEGTSSSSSGGSLAQEILDAHNSYRSQVGVPPLQWSDSLAASAQQWANQLAATGTFEHSSAGENLAQGSSGAFSITNLVNMWGSEKQYFVYGIFPEVSNSGSWSDVGHYTQMIWRNTTEVGCGLASGNGNDILVCHYNPPGNVIGQNVF